MPHDKNGVRLQVGDKVNIPCTVKEVYTGEKDCNVLIEPDHTGNSEYRPNISLNAGAVIKTVDASPQG